MAMSVNHPPCSTHRPGQARAVHMPTAHPRPLHGTARSVCDMSSEFSQQAPPPWLHPSLRVPRFHTRTNMPYGVSVCVRLSFHCRA